MLNILSYVGMSLQSELCLWAMLGLLRTIFDATLFKVNANLKQVWQMNMPPELTIPVQRVLRTMISGVMLVQCFTDYVYLATYIVLLYPVFLEERPTLVLPWLLLAAIRKFLCQFTSLALGLGACVLLGPARPPCIKFVIIKIATITPAFYMWMLVFSYYHALKVSSTFKTFTAVLPTSNDHNDGLELAVRRRRTKSLLDEEQLRKRLVSTLNYGSRQCVESMYLKPDISSRMVHSTDTNLEDLDVLQPLSVNSERILSDVGSYEDWYGNEVILPRDTDRILEQFVLMLLRISSYLQAEQQTDPSTLFSSHTRGAHYDNPECTMPCEDTDTDTPLHIGNSRGKTASYLQEYPHIFMKKTDTMQFQEQNIGSLNTNHSAIENDENAAKTKSQRVDSIRSNAIVDNDSSSKKTINKQIPIKESTSFTHLPFLSNKVKSNELDLSKRKDIDERNTIKSKILNEEPTIELPEVNTTYSLKCSSNHNEITETLENNDSTDSVDSLQCIINRMKKSLSQNRKSKKQVVIEKETDTQPNCAVNNSNTKNIVPETKKSEHESSDSEGSSKTGSEKLRRKARNKKTE